MTRPLQPFLAPELSSSSPWPPGSWRPLLTRYTVTDTGIATRFAATVLNFVVALPLIALLLGPFHIRRLRRGLRELLQRREPT